MRTVLAGNLTDSTAAVVAWLHANRQLTLATLYLIGEAEDPRSFWLTDYNGPLLWSAMGTFLPTVISRGQVESKVGLEVSPLDVTWTPKAVPGGPSISSTTGTPYELARAGFFDNAKFRAWTCFMPTPGDADTFGCAELFGGWIQRISIARGSIKFTVESFLSAADQSVPNNVIEATNTLAGFKAATPPAGFSYVPQLNVCAGSGPTVLIGIVTYPSGTTIIGGGTLVGGYVVFNRGTGGTAEGCWSAIAANSTITVDGVQYNRIQLYSPLPFAPTVGVDTFYVSGAFPIDQSGGSYVGFPYVPASGSAA